MKTAKTMWRQMFLALLAVAPVFAQQKTGSISGVVRDASTDALLSGVAVSADDKNAITDSQGRFTLDDLSSGSKWVQAWERDHAGSGGIYVSVSAGQQAAAEIRLKLGGSIAGRVLDEEHRPVTGAVVILLARRYENGKLAYFPVHSAPIGKDGVYRLEAVFSGSPYLILAKKPLKPIPASEDLLADPGKRDRVLAPSYYPNAGDISAAQTVTLAPGEVRTGVDIRMGSASSYCLVGTVDGVGNAEDISVTLMEKLTLGAGWSLAPATLKADSRRKFAACGLHPGEYELSAFSIPPDHTWSAESGVRITDRDLEDFKLPGRPVATISGEVIFDPPPRDKPGTIQVGLMRFANLGNGYADSLEKPTTFNAGGGLGTSRPVKVPGAFSLGSSSSGDWRIRLGRLPAGCYLKEASYGTQDVLYGTLRMGEASDGAELRLVVGCDGGTLTAKVTDEKGDPVSHVSLYLMAAETSSEGELALSLRRTEVVNGWSVPLANLPPGKYLAVATELDVEPMEAAAYKIEKLWQARGSAKEVEIGAGGMVQITVQPLSME